MCRYSKIQRINFPSTCVKSIQHSLSFLAIFNLILHCNPVFQPLAPIVTQHQYYPCNSQSHSIFQLSISTPALYCDLAFIYHCDSTQNTLSPIPRYSKVTSTAQVLPLDHLLKVSVCVVITGSHTTHLQQLSPIAVAPQSHSAPVCYFCFSALHLSDFCKHINTTFHLSPEQIQTLL